MTGHVHVRENDSFGRPGPLALSTAHSCRSFTCAGIELLVELILDMHVNDLGTWFVRGPRFPSASMSQLTCVGLLNRPTRWAKGCPHIINELQIVKYVDLFTQFTSTLP